MITFTYILAHLFGLVLSIVLGGLLGFFIKVIIALILLPAVAILVNRERKHAQNIATLFLLTIEFLANIFRGYLANYIGIWVFNYFNVPIGLSYPVFILIAFIWLGSRRLHNEHLRIREETEYKQNNVLRSHLPEGAIQKQITRLSKDKLVNNSNNSRITGMIGKATGVILGAIQLILHAR